MKIAIHVSFRPLILPSSICVSSTPFGVLYNTIQYFNSGVLKHNLVIMILSSPWILISVIIITWYSMHNSNIFFNETIHQRMQHILNVFFNGTTRITSQQTLKSGISRSNVLVYCVLFGSGPSLIKNYCVSVRVPKSKVDVCVSLWTNVKRDWDTRVLDHVALTRKILEKNKIITQG